MATQNEHKRLAKFMAELARFGEETGETPPTLYEDINTPVVLSDAHIEGDRLYYTLDGFEDYDDVDELTEWLKHFRACLQRARKYWATDSETLDILADRLTTDEEEEDDTSEWQQ